jgi:hypothetical protein
MKTFTRSANTVVTRVLQVSLAALTLGLALSAGPNISWANNCDAHCFEQIEIIDQIKGSLPNLKAGEVPTGSLRELFIRFFARLPMPLELPLNSEKLITIQTRTGEYRPGISPIWSSERVLSKVLSLSGSFGPDGPIGFRIGPIGDKPINPWFWWQRAVRAGVWATVPKDILREAGPLNPTTGVFSQLGPDASDWLQGNFSVLGTNSFAGPKGPLGPLGPMGALMSLDELTLSWSGYYLDKESHKIVESIIRMIDHDPVKYDVVEKLADAFSEELSKDWLLGTSYLVDSHFEFKEKMKTFRSTAPNSEIVSAIVVPDLGVTTRKGPSLWPKRMNFNLRAVTGQGREIIRSGLEDKVNLIQFQVRQGERFAIQVSPQGQTYYGEPQNFRVIVTGSNAHYGTYLWERILGSDFATIWENPTDNTDLIFAYLWVRMMRATFDQFDQMLKTGQTSIDQPVDFWKRITTGAMEDFRTLKTKSSSKNGLNQALLREAHEALREYKEIVTSKRMSGAFMLEMWRKTMANSATSAETMFNLDAESAKKIPFAWLEWMEAVLAKFSPAFEAGDGRQ